MTSSVFIGIDAGKGMTFYALKQIEGGYALVKGDGEEHHVRRRNGRWSCDCKAYTFSSSGKHCKHLEILKKETGPQGILKEIT